MNESTGGKLGSVMRLAHGASDPLTIAKAQVEVGDLVLDEDYVYWTVGGARIVRAKKTGGPPTTVVVGGPNVNDLAVDSSSLYWVQGDPFGARQIATSKKTGGATRILAVGQRDLAIAPLFLTAERVVWMTGHEVRSVPKIGGQVSTNTGRADALGADVDHVYWSSNQDLFRQNAAGTTLSMGVPFWRPNHVIKTDDLYVYGGESGWTMKGAHPARVWRVSRKGGCPIVVAALPHQYFNRFEVYNHSVYWADDKQGTILMVSP